MKNCCIIVSFALFCPAYGTTVSTPAQSASSGLKSALEIYVNQNDGALPQNWTILSEFFLKRENPPSIEGRPYILRALDKQVGGKIENSFDLVLQHNVQMVRPNPNEIFHGGTIVAVITSPVSEDRRKGNGRYVIWRDTKGSFHSSWLDESVIQAQFERAGLSLPVGPILKQPSALGPDGVFDKYSRENFKNPAHPTAEEWEKMKQDFAEREKYSGQAAAVKSETSNSAPTTPQTSAPKETSASIEAKSPSSFPIAPTAIIAVLIIGVAVFLLQRK